MGEFALLYRNGDRALSHEERQAHLNDCLAWFKDLMDRGVIKDPGIPLRPEGKVVSGAQRVIHDGPYAEAKDILSGFTLIQAADLAEAVEIAKGSPMARVGGSVEVRPVGTIGGCVDH